MSWNKFSSGDLNSHSHSNKSTLDKFSENGGVPLFNGQAIGGGGSSSIDTYMKFKGKNIICFGDSITQGTATINYPKFLGENLSASVTNKGSSGATHNRFRLIACGGTSSSGTTYVEPDYSNIDVVTLTIGHNGGVGSSTINDIIGVSDFNLYPDTFYGNFCRVIEHILYRKSSLRIFLLTPIQSLNSGYIVTTAEATTAIIEIGKKYALPVINLQHVSGLHFRNLSIHTSDGTHPIESGHRMIAEVIARQILSY